MERPHDLEFTKMHRRSLSDVLIPNVDDVVVLELGATAIAGRRLVGRPVGLGVAVLHEADFCHDVRAVTLHPRRQSVDAHPNALQQIAHHLLPPLTGFEVVQFLQDRLGVVLVHPDLGHGPRRAQPDGGMRRVAE
jgi:hypothetical protein